MQRIDVATLSAWRKEGKPHQLIDIRESYEREACSIGGIAIAMDQILERTSDFLIHEPVVIHCNSGKRSDAVVFALEKKLKRQNLFSLEGGIQAWREHIDPSLECF